MIQSNIVYDLKRKGNCVRKTEVEIKEHQRLYSMYNRLFGDLGERNKERNRKYYREHREEILRKLRKPFREHTSIVTQCNYDCFECPYDDCIQEGYGNRKEYMDLYYKKFHDKLLKQKAEYRESNRTYLSNSEKIRNYIKRGYEIIPVIFENVPGILVFLQINKKPYISYISNDKTYSFREKIQTSTCLSHIIKIKTETEELLFVRQK